MSHTDPESAHPLDSRMHDISFRRECDEMPSSALVPNLFRRVKEDSPESLEKERLKSSDEKIDTYALSATQQLSVVAAVAFVLSLFVANHACSERDECSQQARCVRSNRSLCAFYSVVTLAADASAGTRVAGSLPLLMQGPCAPGEIINDGSCIPHFTYPSSINRDIMDPSASTHHERACGKWLRAGGLLLGQEPVYRSFGDHENWLQALKKAEDDATSDARLTTSPMHKFRSKCESTVDAGPPAMRAAAIEAFQYLRAPIDNIRTKDDVLRAAGFLASHFCDGPAKMAVYLHVLGTFVTFTVAGSAFDKGVMGESLFVVDGTEEEIRDAENANNELNNIRNAPGLNASQFETFFEGAAGRSSTNSTVAHSDDMTLLSGLAQMDIQPASAYLRGVAAFCTFSLNALVENVKFGPSLNMRAKLRSKKTITSLSTVEERRPFTEQASNESVIEASSATLSQLGGEHAGNCLDLMRVIFVDHVDEARFESIYTKGLYERLETLVSKVRQSVVEVVETTPIADVLASPLSVSNAVKDAAVRIAGAPRFTWGGLQRPLAETTSTSSEGMLLQALRQARAIFMDRIAMDSDNAGLCDHVPLLSSTEANAYALPYFSCTNYFLGLSHAPWLDSAFSDSSIAGRALHVFAHELAHMTIGRGFRRDEYFDLLQDYDENTHEEAIADVIAVMAVVKSGLTTFEDAMLNFCQSWCARTPFLYLPLESSHPLPNERCDRLHKTFERIGFF